MLYQVGIGEYVIMTGSEGIKLLEKAWHDAACSFLNQHRNTGIESPIAVPDKNAAHISAKDVYHL